MPKHAALFLFAFAAAGQTRPPVTSHVVITDIEGKSQRVVFSSPKLFEAPNWSPDGKYLLLNSEGKLWRLAVDGGEPAQMDTGEVTGVNNDHGISPDGKWFAVSAGQIFVLPSSGGVPRQVTEKRPSYFHGWSPDGKTLVYCAQREANFDLYAIPAAGGPERRLTENAGYDDGPDYSPDGKWIYFNSDRSGSWDIWRIPAAGAGAGDSLAERVTSDEYEDWFPHPSPNGRWMVFVSFEKGTKGHPANRARDAAAHAAQGRAGGGGDETVRRAGNPECELVGAGRKAFCVRPLRVEVTGFPGRIFLDDCCRLQYNQSISNSSLSPVVQPAVILSLLVRSLVMRPFKLFLALAALLLPGILGLAQVSTSRLEGTIQDGTGAVVPGAKIEVVNLKTQIRAETASDAQGRYIFPSLAPSNYRLSVEATGFRKAVREGVVLNVGDTVTEVIALEVGAVTESVVVEANAVRVQTADSQVARAITLRDIDVLPSLGRGPMALAILSPGVQIDASDTSYSHVNGARQGSNNTTLDGIEVNDPVAPRLGLVMTPTTTDTVEEFRVVTNCRQGRTRPERGRADADDYALGHQQLPRRRMGLPPQHRHERQ